MNLRHPRIGYLYVGFDLAWGRDCIIAIGLIPRSNRREGEIAHRVTASISWDWLPPRIWYVRTTLCGEPLGPNEFYAGSWTGLKPVACRIDWKHLHTWFQTSFSYLPN